MEILITGGEQGLGKAIVDLVHHSNTVRNIDGKFLYNIADQGSLRDELYTKLDGMAIEPDVIINNFGINHLSWIGTTPERDSLIFDINVMIPYWIVNYYANQKVRDVRVLNISSQTHRVPQRCTTLYCASKAALVQMTKVMARELAGKYDWVINCYAPGKIHDTKMAELTDKQVAELRGWNEYEVDTHALNNIPMMRFMHSSEAAIIAWNILGMPSYVNGSIIEATGGA